MVHRKAMTRPELDSKLRKKLQNIKNGMIGRCYNPKNPKYKNYGARGVTVDARWHRIKGLLEDFDSIEGWDEDLFLQGNLQLDKDIKIRGNKIYSKETCTWVTPEENIKVKPSYQRDYIGVRVDGYKEKFTNTVDFMREHSINQANGIIREVADGKRAYYSGWYFYYQDSEPKPPVVYKAEKGDKEYVSFSQRDVERYIDSETPIGLFSKMKRQGIKEKYYEGWRISWYSLPC